MEDLGAKFSRDKSFCFDRIIIQEIIFDDTHDVTLFCTVPYYGELYVANFGLSFAQLNTLLRSTKPEGNAVATALAEKLDGEIEIPSVLDIEATYGKPFEINNCVLYTTLYDISDDENDDMDEDDMEDDFSKNIGDTSDDEDDDDDYEAYAFLIDEIRIKGTIPFYEN